MQNLHTLNKGRFLYGDCEDAWYKGFDDQAWKEVFLPHDWSVAYDFSKEYSSGTGYMAGGIGWYRLHFSLPKNEERHAISVIFDGIYKNSQVWCNSYYLGKRPNGYSTFRYDITHAVRFGEDNVLCVKVTHTDLADSRWFTGSGITRKVTLLVQEMVHPKEYGVTFIGEVNSILKDQNNEICRGDARVTIRHEAEGRTQTERLKVRTVILEKGGTEVFAAEKDYVGNTDCVLSGNAKGVRLWSDKDPYLYLMRSYYSINDKEYSLCDEQEIGFRKAEFTADSGFFLNEQETKIKGVCVHHDGGCLGAAMQPEIWQRRLELLKECGCNAIRCSHNPHMPELYSLCDHLGFLVMDEAFDEWENAKNKWSTGHNVYPPKHQGYFADFPEWHERDLRMMVKRDRNHPSVILWSIGNEIDYPNDPYCHPSFTEMIGNNDLNKPVEERRYDPNKPDARRMVTIAEELCNIVRSEDSTRYVTLASAFPELSADLGLYSCLDIIGYNYKEEFYESDHRRFVDQPLIGSENGHSYQAWLAVLNHKYISGQFLWTGIDYLGEAKGWPVRGSNSGLISCAGTLKQEYFRRKSFWKESPVLALATARKERQLKINHMERHWNYKEGEEIVIRAFSNMDCVVLSLNGYEIGESRQRDEDGSFYFETEFHPGVLKAEAYTKDDRQTICRAELVTTGSCTGIQYSVYQGNDVLTGHPYSIQNTYPGYLYQITWQLCDDEGHEICWENREIKIEVSKDGEIAGLENGNLSDLTSYRSHMRMTDHGQLVSYIRRIGKGSIEVMATTGNYKKILQLH